ncbi:MAG TPA: hypothetical protein PLQ00_00165 [Thermoguttaceae bacterium]|nr:hypothetical protein [Thermoguttaceae bacterium]
MAKTGWFTQNGLLFPKGNPTVSVMLWGRLIGLAALGVWLSWSVGPADAAESVWELLPYRVRIAAAVEPGPTWPADLEKTLTQYLADRCDSLIGALWEVQADQPPPALARKMLADLEGLHEADVPAAWQEGDKVLLAAVRAKGQGWQVQAREWDVRTRRFGATVSVDLQQPAKLGQTTLNAMIAAFCPLARIDHPKEGRALLRPRGMALPCRPGAPEWIRPGLVFRPVVRKNDREGKPLSIKLAPWTYLAVERVQPQGLDCKIYTGFSGAISERRRGRIEMLGLAAAPLQRPTVLCLADRNAPDQPLAGYEVWAYAPGRRQPVLLGRSNLRGELVLSPTSDGLLILVITSGGTPVARLPVAPGVESRLQVLLPRETPRIAAEAFVRGFQEALLDLVGQREILLARLQRRLEQGRTEEAAQLLDQLESLRTQRDALALDLSEKEKSISSADPAIRAKIESLWTQARQLLAQQADDRILRQMASQLLQAKAGPDRPTQPPTPKP